MQRKLFFISVLVTVLLILPCTVFASEISGIPAVDINISTADEPQQVVTTLQMLFLFTIIALAPSILLMTTCFTRILISLHFVRSALGTQQMPPNQIMISIALFVSLFLMGPTFDVINQTALQPYLNQQMSQADAIETGIKPLREFMIRQAEDKDTALFMELAGETFTTYDAVPTRVLIPAFVLGEITKAFKFGVIIYLPFIAIDMIVASVLMAMGMMMLPPAMISLPFKILLFVMVDGWSLVIENLVKTFQ